VSLQESHAAAQAAVVRAARELMKDLTNTDAVYELCVLLTLEAVEAEKVRTALPEVILLGDGRL
jgi:hypothetical protein